MFQVDPKWNLLYVLLLYYFAAIPVFFKFKLSPLFLNFFVYFARSNLSPAQL